MRDRFDLIVVGAGPGGSNAAAAALRRGLSVGHVEARVFPRVKPCAGALTVKACNSLVLDLAPTLRRSFPDIEFNAWGGTENRFRHRSQMVAMVLRPEFDNSLVRQNQGSERFTFFDGEPVTGIEFDGSDFIVTTAIHRLKAPQIVGADGAYSIVNRTFGIAHPKALAIAVEVNLPNAAARQGVASVPCLDFGALPKGYGWVFPKDDHYSVGLYTFAKGLKDLRRKLVLYARAKCFDVSIETLPTMAGYHFPVGGYVLKRPPCPVYLVGDAGGFGDAITGEGIYYALESGRLAGEAAADAHAGRAKYDRYYDDLWLTVLSDTFITYHLARQFYRNPLKGIRILENPLVWRPCVLGHAEGATVRKVLTHGGLYFVRSLFSDLIDRTATPHVISYT